MASSSSSSASSAPLPIKIIESCRVSPPPGTTPERASLPFTYFDFFWTILPPVERLFFYDYPHSTDHFVTSHLPSLKSSLSAALQTYYPLAGGYRKTPGTEDRYEHYYVEGDSVPFSLAECNGNGGGKFEDLAGDHERRVSLLCCLVPQLPKSDEVQPLFSVQVTIFPGEGIVIGTTVHHTACDGTSSMQFMHAWAETCLASGASVSFKAPIFDRTLVSDPSDLYSLFYKKVQDFIKAIPQGSIIPAKDPSELILATFTLNQEQIQGFKRLISAKAEERKTPIFRCSTIVVTFAYAWICFIRAKRIEITERVCFGIPADFRPRVKPPLPTEYFGNCVGTCMPKAVVSDLIQEDGFGLFAAAEAVGKAIDEMVKASNFSTSVFDDYVSYRTPILSVAGSPKFRVYEVDFGFGRPRKVEVVSTVKTGAMSVAESRGEPGGVEIGIAFPKDEMDIFKKCFYDGLKMLSN